MSDCIDIDFIPTCVSIFKKVGDDFVFVDFNKKAEKLDNITKDKLIGQKLTKIYPSVKEFGIFDAFCRVEKTGKSEIFNMPFYKDSRVSGYRKNEIAKLPNGNIITFFTDTQVETELEAFFEDQRNLFQAVMQDSTVISVQGYDSKHKVVYWNKASEIIYGYSQKEAIGKKLEDLIIPENIKDIVYQGVENWIYNDIEIPSSELTLVDKFGNDVFVYSQHKMIHVARDKREMYCIDIDLSSTKKLQQELLIQRDFLKTLLDAIPDLIWVKDVDSVFISCNAKFEQFFGVKEFEIVGKTDFDFVDKKLAESFRKNDEIAIQKGSPSINEEYLEFADGSHKGYFETIRTPIKDSSGKITAILGIAHDISLHKNYQKQLLEFANTDLLTGLSNRAVLFDRLEQLLKHRKSKDRHGAIFFLDLDNFKEINNTKGHHIGDELLVEISKRLKKIVRKGDTVARLGGDEFVLLLEQVATRADANHVAKKALEAILNPIFIEKYNLSITASIGIAIFPNDSDDSEKLLNYADEAMYYAKKHGKNRYRFYSDIIDHP